MAILRTRPLILATLACAAALSACGSDETQQEQALDDATTSSPTPSPENTPTSEPAVAESTTAESTTTATTVATTASFAAAPAPMVERDPADFTEAEPTDPFAAYAITLSPGNMCVYYAGGGYFSCDLALAGALPPLDPDYGAPAGQHPDVIMWGDDRGFAVTHSTGGGEGTPEAAQLFPGQNVTAGDYTFHHLPDGTVRVERGEHWFQVSPQGQYSSDRFTP